MGEQTTWLAVIRPDGNVAMYKDSLPCLVDDESRAITLAKALSEKYGCSYTVRPATLTVGDSK